MCPRGTTDKVGEQLTSVNIRLVLQFCRLVQVNRIVERLPLVHITQAITECCFDNSLLLPSTTYLIESQSARETRSHSKLLTGLSTEKQYKGQPFNLTPFSKTRKEGTSLYLNVCLIYTTEWRERNAICLYALFSSGQRKRRRESKTQQYE